MRTWAVWSTAALAVALGGCSWPQARFDGGHSNDNPVELFVRASTVGGLHEVWTAAHAAGSANPPIIVGDEVVSGDGNHLAGYALSGCTGTGIPDCAPRWTHPGSYTQLASDGASLFTRDVAGTRMQAFDLAGNATWSFSASGIESGPVVADGLVWIGITQALHGAPSFSLVALPAAGCGAATCTTTATIAPGQYDNGWAVMHGSVYAVQNDPSAQALRVFDAATGTERWQSRPASYANVWMRDAHVFAGGSYGGPSSQYVDEFDVNPASGCDAAPVPHCAPAAHTPLGLGSLQVLTAAHAVTIDTYGDARWYATDLANDCVGGECAWVATSRVAPTVGTSPYATLAGAGGLVFVGWGNSVGAVDDALATGCRAVPVGAPICDPLWTATLPAHVEAIVAAAGRVLVASDDGRVHVFAL